ncbi:MAG: nucleoside hydrolase [Burkholderiaceae bacterium]|jgi:inosine-uridine nucleoside N-ribohydrolase
MTTTATPTRIIYDTDPGVDDAIALYFALAHPAIDVVGITTTFGNVSVEQAAANALYLAALAGYAHIPVTKGVAAPLAKHAEPPPAFIHGADGLGNLPSRQATSNQLDTRSSAQFIVDMARANPGNITLVAVGPLGNVSLALQLEPQLPMLLRDVVIMGGTVLEPGNVSPVAEANIWNDPLAADHVFAAGFQLTMVGLDVTHKVVTELALFDAIASHQQHPATDTLRHAVAFYADFYSGLHDTIQNKGCFAHDLLAFVYVVAPELFGVDSGVIRVAVDGHANGQTMMNRRAHSNYPQAGWADGRVPTQVCMRVDAQACLALFESTLMDSAWLQPARTHR